MNLSELHVAVRGMVRDGAAADEAMRLSEPEHDSLRALRRRLGSVGGDLRRLIPPANAEAWMAPPMRGYAD